MRDTKNLLIVLSLFVFSALVGRATAQIQMEAHATIPFEFWIEGDRLAAGVYQIEQIESTSYLLFISTDGAVCSAYTVAIDDKPVKDGDARLIFRVQDGRHYLYGGWGPYGKHVLKAEAERTVPSGDNRVEIPVSFR
jgi:hypothetical protein